jgi:hypothetical protein
MSYEERKAELIELAFYDDSESYSTDEGGIYLCPKTMKLIFLSASGCSCWDGDYEEDSFDSLLDVEIALLKGGENGEDLYKFHPSLARCKEMLEEAKKKLPASWVEDSRATGKIKGILEFEGWLSKTKWNTSEEVDVEAVRSSLTTLLKRVQREKGN